MYMYMYNVMCMHITQAGGGVSMCEDGNGDDIRSH